MSARGLLATVVIPLMAAAAHAQEPVSIDSRLELFVDDYLIDTLSGGAALQLHRPVRREIVYRTDAPWEGNASAFCSVFRDGDLYRMYYRGLHYRHSGEPAQALADHPWVLCYAESDDGKTWRRPELGIHEFLGSTANNIVLTPEAVAEIGGDPAHTSAWLDANPACPPDERIKITIIGSKPKGMYVLGSADGTHFRLLTPEPCQTIGAFDSQNLMFWDPVLGQYREYHRGFDEGVRAIMTATSPDYRHFPEPQWLQYVASEPEHLYTNQVQPYFRAPHILMGFPMRYTDRDWSQPVLELPMLDERLARAAAGRRYGTAVTDALFMTSRDGLLWNRWPEAFIRPGPRERESWVYGDNFIFWQMVPTASDLEDAPDEISLYATESYWEGTSTAFRRYTIRTDGFVSAYAPMAGGEIVTKPMVFDGGNLALNFATSGAGSVQVELQEPDGTPIPGYALADCPEIYGDHLRFIVRWNDVGGDLRPLVGRPVRLRFVLRDADLYSMQFVPWEPEPDYPDLTQFGAIPRKNPERAPFVAIADDFEGIRAGTGETQESFLPEQAAAGATGWAPRAQYPDRLQVLNDDPPGSGNAGANQYVKLQRRDEPQRAGGILWLTLAPHDIADSTNSVVEVWARIFVPSGNGGRVDIDALDAPLGTWSGRAFHVRFAPDGQVTYYRERENPIEGLKIALDTWQQVSIRADFATATFDLTVEGQTATGLPFAEDVHRLQSLAFAPNSNNATFYLDDVTVRITP